MKINVVDKSTGVVKIPVWIVKPIWDMSIDQIIKLLDIEEKILDYHYNFTSEYQNVDDIYSEEIIEYLAEVLFDYCQSSKFNGYYEIAERIMEKLADKMADEIRRLDEDARQYANEVEEARRGQY
jgi:hypothetical protein|nr:MAG TPA: PROTEIN HNS-DEPENDENT EXPRESSION A HELICAL, STRUCTURAL PROTEIN.0A [Caudoviricetes sp.]